MTCASTSCSVRAWRAGEARHRRQSLPCWRLPPPGHDRQLGAYAGRHPRLRPGRVMPGLVVQEMRQDRLPARHPHTPGAISQHDERTYGRRSLGRRARRVSGGSGSGCARATGQAVRTSTSCFWNSSVLPMALRASAPGAARWPSVGEVGLRCHNLACAPHRVYPPASCRDDGSGVRAHRATDPEQGQDEDAALHHAAASVAAWTAG
jgi:hypothetical protein